MCGIAGIIGTVEPGAVRSPLGHRGPDDAGTWHADGVHLYHWRLSVIDLSPAGHQPMVSRCGAYVICYNGEIYNFEDLRPEIAAVHANSGMSVAWRGHSDTEVILEGFALWGESFLARLNGMFAIAVYDQRQKRLTITRDRMGIKPLYIWQPPGGAPLAFASEAKFFHDIPCFEPELNPTGLASFFIYGHGFGENRILKDVRQIRPGELLQVDVESRQTSSTSFVPTRSDSSRGAGDTQARRNPQSDHSYSVALRKILAGAVERQLVADVPVGVFLSGGVDSAILTALCAQSLGPGATKAFTLGYTGFDLNFNEVEEARAVARHLGVKHYIYEASSQDLIDTLEAMVWHYDEPFGDAASLNMMVLSRLVRSEVTVALAGEGSDELFGGYRRYQVERLIRRFGPFSSLAQRLIQTTGLQEMRNLPRRVAILLRSLSHRSAGRRYSAYFESGIDLTELIRPEWLPSADSLFDPRDRLEELYPDDLGGVESVAALCRADQQFWLLDTYLEKSDKGAMAHSLEVRVPFLDNEVVEFANGLPDHFRIRGRQGKWLLKEAFKDLVPERVFTRMKRGFAVPLSHWLRGDLKDYFADQVLSPTSQSREFLQEVTVKRYFTEHQKGVHDRSQILWYCLIFEVWLRLTKNGFKKPVAMSSAQVPA